MKQYTCCSKYILSGLTLVGAKFEQEFAKENYNLNFLFTELSKQNSLRYKTSKLMKFLVVHIDEV